MRAIGKLIGVTQQSILGSIIIEVGLDSAKSLLRDARVAEKLKECYICLDSGELKGYYMYSVIQIMLNINDKAYKIVVFPEKKLIRQLYDKNDFREIVYACFKERKSAKRRKVFDVPLPEGISLKNILIGRMAYRNKDEKITVIKVF